VKAGNWPFLCQKIDNMIQRVQTIFLFLVVICMGITIGSTLWVQTETGSGTDDSWQLSAFMLSNLDSSGEVIQESSKWYIATLAAFAGLMA